MTSVPELLRTAAANGLPTAPVGVPVGPLDHVAWSELVAHAQWQRITHLLTLSLTAGAIPATEVQLEHAIELDEAEIASALHLEALLLDVAAVLEHRAVAFRVLKGPAVAHLDYPDPVWRGFGDIDLLVPPGEFDQAVDALHAHGFTRRFPEPRRGFDRRFTKSVSLAGADGEQIDLHRTLAAGGFGQRVIISMLWAANPGTFELGGREFSSLGAEERFLHACYHAALGNVPPRLAPLRDVAEMLVHGGVDADRVRVLAAAWQGETVLAHAVTTAWQALRLTPSTPLSRWAAEFRAPRRQHKELARATAPGYTYAAQAVDQLRALSGRRRFAYVSALAFPQRGYIRGRHSGLVARSRRAVADVLHAQTTPRGEP